MKTNLFKRILAGLLSALMLGSMAACAGGGETAETTAPVDTTPAETEPVETEPTVDEWFSSEEYSRLCPTRLCTPHRGRSDEVGKEMSICSEEAILPNLFY